MAKKKKISYRQKLDAASELVLDEYTVDLHQLGEVKALHRFDEAAQLLARFYLKYRGLVELHKHKAN